MKFRQFSKSLIKAFYWVFTIEVILSVVLLILGGLSSMYLERNGNEVANWFAFWFAFFLVAVQLFFELGFIILLYNYIYKYRFLGKNNDAASRLICSLGCIVSLFVQIFDKEAFSIFMLINVFLFILAIFAIIKAKDIIYLFSRRDT